MDTRGMWARFEGTMNIFRNTRAKMMKRMRIGMDMVRRNRTAQKCLQSLKTG